VAYKCKNHGTQAKQLAGGRLEECSHGCKEDCFVLDLSAGITRPDQEGYRAAVARDHAQFARPGLNSLAPA